MPTIASESNFVEFKTALQEIKKNIDKKAEKHQINLDPVKADFPKAQSYHQKKIRDYYFFILDTIKNTTLPDTQKTIKIYLPGIIKSIKQKIKNKTLPPIKTFFEIDAYIIDFDILTAINLLNKEDSAEKKYINNITIAIEKSIKTTIETINHASTEITKHHQSLLKIKEYFLSKNVEQTDEKIQLNQTDLGEFKEIKTFYHSLKKNKLNLPIDAIPSKIKLDFYRLYKNVKKITQTSLLEKIKKEYRKLIYFYLLSNQCNTDILRKNKIEKINFTCNYTTHQKKEINDCDNMIFLANKKVKNLNKTKLSLESNDFTDQLLKNFDSQKKIKYLLKKEHQKNIKKINLAIENEIKKQNILALEKVQLKTNIFLFDITHNNQNSEINECNTLLIDINEKILAKIEQIKTLEISLSGTEKKIKKQIINLTEEYKRKIAVETKIKNQYYNKQQNTNKDSSDLKKVIDTIEEIKNTHFICEKNRAHLLKKKNFLEQEKIQLRTLSLQLEITSILNEIDKSLLLADEEIISKNNLLKKYNNNDLSIDPIIELFQNSNSASMTDFFPKISFLLSNLKKIINEELAKEILIHFNGIEEKIKIQQKILLEKNESLKSTLTEMRSHCIKNMENLSNRLKDTLTDLKINKNIFEKNTDEKQKRIRKNISQQWYPIDALPILFSNQINTSKKILSQAESLTEEINSMRTKVNKNIASECFATFSTHLNLNSLSLFADQLYAGCKKTNENTLKQHEEAKTESMELKQKNELKLKYQHLLDQYEKYRNRRYWLKDFFFSHRDKRARHAYILTLKNMLNQYALFNQHGNLDNYLEKGIQQFSSGIFSNKHLSLQKLLIALQKEISQLTFPKNKTTFP